MELVGCLLDLLLDLLLGWVVNEIRKIIVLVSMKHGMSGSFLQSMLCHDILLCQHVVTMFKEVS
jgi:hypothetical protein